MLRWSTINILIKRYRAFPIQVKASLWFLLCSILQRGISVITTPIFTRLLPTADYGQLSVFNSWLDVVSIFVTFRLYYGVFVQGLVKYEDDRACYASSLQGLELMLCFCWTLVYLMFQDFWNNLFGLTTVQMLAMLVMIWSTGAFRFWAAEQRNRLKYRTLVAVTLIVSVLKPVIGIFFVIHADDKVTARILGLAIAELAGYSGMFFIQMRRGKQFFSGKYWKHALMFNLPLIPHYLSQTVLNSADRIMIRDMVGASEAGIYSLAYSISRIMLMFNTALTQTLMPWIYRKIKAGRPKEIERIAYPALIVVAGLNLITIAFGPEIVAIFAPAPYYDAIWVIPPVAMSVYFTFSYSLFSCYEFYFEKTKFIMLASLVGAVLNVILNYIFIRIFSYYAAGYTTLTCYILYAIGHFLFMRKVCKECLNGIKVYDLKWLLSITIVFLTLGFVLLTTYSYMYLRYSLIAIFLILCVWKRQLVASYASLLFDVMKNRKKKSP